MNVQITGNTWRNIPEQTAIDIARYIGFDEETLRAKEQVHSVMLEGEKLYLYAIRRFYVMKDVYNWKYTKSPKVW